MLDCLEKNEKRAKAIEVHDAQECAEIWHTAARSLDTERWNTDSFFFHLCNTESLQFASETDIHIFS